MAKTKIEWCTTTWNPVTGCSKVSEGCRHCYAETLSLRFGWSEKPWTHPNASKNVVLHPERLNQPFSWRDPHVVFVNSMSDVFHELVPFEFIDEIFRVMEACPKHTFQVLTKRPKIMADWFAWKGEQFGSERYAPTPNIWLGTSVENMWAAERRISDLVSITASVRFLSCEPLLGPLDLRRWLDVSRGVNWVIVGGESGPKHRPMAAEWARNIREQCLAAGVPFFFKQWGGRTPKAGGRELDGRLWDDMPGPTAATALKSAPIDSSEAQPRNLDFLSKLAM